MIDTIYLEEGVESLPKTEQVLRRFPRASVIRCKHYKEVFNPSAQSFRLQKKKPALILAKQTGKHIHSIPPSYGIGGKNNFYFSHLLNCLYDCRYCFLQGMYPSAHYVLFVNFDDFKEEIKKMAFSCSEDTWFFSGYDCDSLALESITGFAADFLPFFDQLPNTWIELRTKSVAIESLKKTKPLDRAVVAFSFTPDEISSQLEHGVPRVDARIKAMSTLADKGWKVGLRIDPLIDSVDFEARYSALFEKIFDHVSGESVHSVSLGAYRMPSGFMKKIEKQYPDDAFFAANLQTNNGMIGYGEDTEKRLKQICSDLLESWMDKSKIFTCEINNK
jgi:spore photoproduct lyase